MRLAAILGSLSGINILLAFGYQWYILTVIGPGFGTDALFAGILIPELLLMVISGPLTYVLVPLFSLKNENEIRNDAWNLIHVSGILFIIIAFVLSFTATIWVPWTVPGFSQETTKLTISIVNIHLVGMVFSAINPVLWSYYHSCQRFIWVEMSQVIATSVGFFILIWKLPQHGVMVAAWAIVVRVAGQLLLLIPGLGSYQLPNFRSSTIREVWLRLYPLMLGSTCFRTDQLVDRFLASMAPAGQLSLLYYARQIFSAGITILIKALIWPIIPTLSRMCNKKDWNSFQRLIHRRTNWLISITLLVLFIILVSGKPTLSLLFGHGKFDQSSISDLHWLLIAMCGFWIGGTLSQIFLTGFYAKKDTKTPTKIGVFGFIIGIVLKVVGFYLWGVIGIAVGTSIHYLLNNLMMKWTLSRQLKNELTQLSQVHGISA